MFSRVIEQVSTVSGWLSGIGIYVMTALVFVDVLLRYFLGSPTMVADTISIYCMIFVTFVGAAMTGKLGKHVSVDLLFQRFSNTTKAWVRAITSPVATIVMAVVTWSTIEWVLYTYDSGYVSAGTMGEPMWIPLACIPLGFFLWTLQYVVESLRNIAALQVQLAGATSAGGQSPAEGTGGVSK